MYYIKKPIPVEAFCFNESVKNNTIPKWFENFNEKEIRIESDKVRICILTLEGPMWCSGDDYIIRGVHGELYPCRRHVFLDSYVPHTPYRHMEETDGIYD